MKFLYALLIFAPIALIAGLIWRRSNRSRLPLLSAVHNALAKIAVLIAGIQTALLVLFTLAHAHGTLLALVNIVVGLTVRILDRFALRSSVSFALIWAAILLPGGFFLGGIVIYDGDPGLGVWLVPVGAALLFYSITRIAIDLSRRK